MNHQHLSLNVCVAKDCSLILDAVRRLKDGTWLLCDEDSDWVDYLMPLIKDALVDHIEYERAFVFPNIQKNLAREHNAEHDRLLALLHALDGSRQRREVKFFKAYLDLLLEALEKHHCNFGNHPNHLSICPNMQVTEKIINRAQGLNLECK